MKKILTVFMLFFSVLSVLWGQAKKPSIMIFPANVWMSENGYTYEVDNQGNKIVVMDYQRAMNENQNLSMVINKIEGLMTDRGFPLENLGATLKDIADKRALSNADVSKEGNEISVSPRDMLLATARPDIILELNVSINKNGPKKSVTFELKGIDAGTNQNIASATGTGNELIGATLPVMLETAVLSHIDNFNNQLQSHFDKMFEEGREISLEIKVWDESPKKLNDEMNEDGDELKDIIKKWMTSNTVKGRNILANSSPNILSFKNVRIPLYEEDGTTAFDADGFAAKLRKYLKKNFGLVSESSAIGLGKGQVVIGGKRG
ncbi:hypothetical protein DM790_25705 [Flavobacterium collinsii]|nr:hypothetical protein [Flavobacterium collinsii]